MKITPLPKTGTSAKFNIELSKGRGSFVLSLSATLMRNVWQLPDEQAELDTATQMAEAIVGRHDPKFPFNKIYVFGDHNSEDTVEMMVNRLKRVAI